MVETIELIKSNNLFPFFSTRYRVFSFSLGNLIRSLPSCQTVGVVSLERYCVVRDEEMVMD